MYMLYIYIMLFPHIVLVTDGSLEVERLIMVDKMICSLEGLTYYIVLVTDGSLEVERLMVDKMICSLKD